MPEISRAPDWMAHAWMGPNTACDIARITSVLARKLQDLDPTTPNGTINHRTREPRIKSHRQGLSMTNSVRNNNILISF